MKHRHDYLYEDRTWFDELGERLLARCARWLPRNQAQLWTTGFALFSSLCVAWAAGLATHCMVFDLPWNQCLAQLLSAALLLAAARHFLGVTDLSASGVRSRRKLIKRTPSRETASTAQARSTAALRTDSAAATVVAATQAPASASDPRDFFCAVKAAGINVRTARALYQAGFRSAEQVRDATDAQLLAAPGIGKATLRNLRLKFGLPRA